MKLFTNIVLGIIGIYTGCRIIEKIEEKRND